MYYEQPDKWLKVVKTSMREILPFFDAGRMADEYYGKLYK
jgi:starch phosphorylase